MAEQTYAELSEFWLAAPADVRMWAIDQARDCVMVTKPFPLFVSDVLDMAQIFVFEVLRGPKPVVAPNIEDNGEDGVDVTNYFTSTSFPKDKIPPLKSWREDRGLA